MTDLVPRYGGTARFNWDKWLVDCAHCTSGLKPGVHLYEDGRLVRYAVEWGDTSMICWDCGQVTENIAWPPDPGAIEVILFMRPDEQNRNWWPGETLAELLLENITHGIMPPADAIEDGRPLMTTMNEVVVGGSLVSLMPEFAAARRLFEIGN